MMCLKCPQTFLSLDSQRQCKDDVFELELTVWDQKELQRLNDKQICWRTAGV